MGVTDTIKKALKDIRLVRVVAKPWMDIKLAAKYEDYLRSGHGDKLVELKDTHLGERCFIIGNGPSLRAEDLDMLKNEYTFAANRIYAMFDKTDWRPWSYVAVDKDFIDAEYSHIFDVPCSLKFLLSEKVRPDEKRPIYRLFALTPGFVVNVGGDISAYIAEDISKGVSNGYTVTFTSIQLAIYMGFKEIYLLGMDFNYANVMDRNGKVQHSNGIVDHFHNDDQGPAMLLYEPCLHAYKVAREYCDAHGITIRNVTRGGKLEVFERLNFDELMTKKEGETK